MTNPPSSPPGLRPRPISTAALALGALFLLAACAREEQVETPPTVRTEVEIAEDEAQAEQLWKKAMIALPRDKVRILGRLIARYPESKFAAQAHLHRVFYLLDGQDATKAFEGTRTFGSTFPDDPAVSEAFSWLARRAEAKNEGEPEGEVVRKAWGEWLENAWERAQKASVEQRLNLQVERATLAAWNGDKKRAMALLEEGSEWESESADLRAKLLYRWASLLKAADGERARAVLERVIAIRPKASGACGVPTLKELEAELESMKLGMK